MQMHGHIMGQDPNSAKHCRGRPGPIFMFGWSETRTAHAHAHARTGSRFVPTSMIAGPDGVEHYYD
jgi:hypothetical protein